MAHVFYDPVTFPKGLTVGTQGLTLTDAGATSTAQTYPPSGINFLTDTQTVTNQPYGNGTYTLSASSIINGAWNAGRIFQGSPSTTSSSWASAQRYNTTTGAYTGSNTLTVSGTAYS